MSNDNTKCLNCNRLGHCTDTSVDKLLSNYVCVRWEEAKPEVVAARQQIITMFGSQGAKAVVSSDFKEDD